MTYSTGFLVHLNEQFPHLSWYVNFFSGMWTARNIFIATLAVADSSLCLFAMPMTLVGILTKYWPFGPQTWLLCKLARSTPAVTIFFSSYTMMVIAIDRQRFIVYSAKRQVKMILSHSGSIFSSAKYLPGGRKGAMS